MANEPIDRQLDFKTLPTKIKEIIEDKLHIMELLC